MMKRGHKIFIVSALCAVAIAFAMGATDRFRGELFDGETLKGWSVHSGHAAYRVEDGAIVGQAVKGSPNSFLCTDREFSDFILEFEVFLDDAELNSGVQFRSQIAGQELIFWFRNDQGKYQSKTIPADRVYGYQVEISSGGQKMVPRRAKLLKRSSGTSTGLNAGAIPSGPS